jgi:Zn-dependent M28 family amino/carboxypeptidase
VIAALLCSLAFAACGGDDPQPQASQPQTSAPDVRPTETPTATATTAALLEIARTLKKVKRGKDAPPIRFAAFDGEEATDDSDFYGTGVRGSKAYAKRHARKLREMVLLDFVADKDLVIPREMSSDQEMWADLRAAASHVGASDAFPDLTQGTVEDDHTPFIRRGVPAIDLIDFSFPCWHQTCDDLSAVSKRSLDKSGETVLEFLTMDR